ncbi:hypothetical protein KIN20_032611 [Parelaphostrongylus tenuis]|uniref:Uncharacterized protein n=1 Tax=Parelaphostrongylus tenuis TaxID=148309 RepID=A0AAD5WHU1_PARTN|nr:hypothetical protein KIN20_032611 [Parelaphostrongylus tenuis]
MDKGEYSLYLQLCALMQLPGSHMYAEIEYMSSVKEHIEEKKAMRENEYRIKQSFEPFSRQPDKNLCAQVMDRKNQRIAVVELQTGVQTTDRTSKVVQPPDLLWKSFKDPLPSSTEYGAFDAQNGSGSSALASAASDTL